jgi:hypothetical protein
MSTWEEFGHILTLKNTSKIDRTKIETSRWLPAPPRKKLDQVAAE